MSRSVRGETGSLRPAPRNAAGDRPGPEGPPPGTFAESPTPGPDAVRGRLAGVSVLVVDDDESSLDYFAMALRVAGAVVATAPTAVDALRLLRDGRPDVVLSDIAMPGHDGYWLVREIRALPDAVARRVPVVATTAYGGLHSRSATLAAGFADHLAKPVEPEVLWAVIARAAGR